MESPSSASAAPSIRGPWWIGLAGWVLEDGNYTDFATGDRRQFALEFGYARSRRLVPAAEGAERRCSYTGHDTAYDVVGQLVRSVTQPGRDAFVLDFGLRAFTNWMVLDDLEPPITGDRLSGEISLHVDPFMYFDELATLPGMPPLIYTWVIEEVQLSTTPRMQVEFGHPLYVGPDEGPMLVGDPAQESWRTVERTRVWQEVGNYRLRCSLDSPEPTHSTSCST